MADYSKIDGVAADSIAKVDGIAKASIAKVKGATKPSDDYDWTASLYNQTSIAATTSVWNSPDVWSGGGGNDRGPNTQNYRVTVIPFLDSSSGTATLKVASIGHAGHSADDFFEVDTGAQAASGNNHLVAISSTGVTFSGGNMVDGDHTIKWKHKHDAKSDTFYTVTTVLTAASNVLTAYDHWQSATSYGSYVSTATAKSSGIVRWQATWDASANTWTVNTSDDDWQQSNNGSVSVTTSGGTLGKYTTQYSIVGSSPADGRMWEITVGSGT